MKKTPKKILVIDDDAGMVRLLEKWLRVAGKLVVAASNGTDGFKKAKEEKPNLILLDIGLPDQNGLQIARDLREDPLTQNIPIIFITISIDVKKDKGDQVIMVDGQTYRAFAKPLHNQKLLSEIRKTINRGLYNTKRLQKKLCPSRKQPLQPTRKQRKQQTSSLNNSLPKTLKEKK